MNKLANQVVVKNCPFCGEQEVYYRVKDESVRVYCLSCGALGPLAFRQPQALELWNIREDTRPTRALHITQQAEQVHGEMIGAILEHLR